MEEKRLFKQIKTYFYELGQLLRDIFYPQRCLECNCIVQNHTLFCAQCRKRYKGKALVTTYGFEQLESVLSVYPYNLKIKRALHLVKYNHARALLLACGRELEEHLLFKHLSAFFKENSKGEAKLFLKENFLVVPIPTEPGRKKQRGYDVPEEIFRPWAEKHCLAWQTPLARRPGGQPQYALGIAQRRSNVKDVFYVTAQVRDKNIILVDDIFTTGATLNEAARVLKEAGAGKIYGLTFSYTEQGSAKSESRKR